MPRRRMACGDDRGTVAGWGRHSRAHQKPCVRCRHAKTAYDAVFRHLFNKDESVLIPVPRFRARQLPCTEDPERWFSTRPGDVRYAQEGCHGCPVQRPCLRYAIDNREMWGTWGGSSEVERRHYFRAEIMQATPSQNGRNAVQLG